MQDPDIEMWGGGGCPKTLFSAHGKVSQKAKPLFKRFRRRRSRDIREFYIFYISLVRQIDMSFLQHLFDNRGLSSEDKGGIFFLSARLTDYMDFYDTHMSNISYI